MGRPLTNHVVLALCGRESKAHEGVVEYVYTLRNVVHLPIIVLGENQVSGEEQEEDEEEEGEERRRRRGGEGRGGRGGGRAGMDGDIEGLLHSLIASLLNAAAAAAAATTTTTTTTTAAAAAAVIITFTS